MRQVLINQSTGSRRGGIVLHLFSLFLPGIFLLLTGGAASLAAVERGAPFFQQGLLHPSFCSKTVFIWKAFLALNSSRGAEPTDRPTAGPANLPPRHRQQTWTLGIWFLLDTDERQEPLVSVCGQILLMSGRLACGWVYWLFTITHFMWFLSEWKYNESVPCFMSQETWLKLSVLKKRSLLVKSH